jgi:hypothetical protein
MSELNKPLAAAMRAMAETSKLPDERLGHLKNALRLDPTNATVAQEIAAILSKDDSAVCYVAIERATIFGKHTGEIEGNIYIANLDGSLRPLSGAELLTFNSANPNFVKNWRLNMQ